MIGYVTCRVYPMLDSSHNYIGWVNSSRPDFWMHCHLFQNLQGASCNPDVCQWLPVLLSQTTWLHNLQNFSMKTLSIRNFLCSNLFHHFAEAITSEVSPMLWSLPLSCKILTWRLNWALALESVFGSMQHAPLAKYHFSLPEFWNNIHQKSVIWNTRFWCFSPFGLGQSAIGELLVDLVGWYKAP